MLVADTYDSYNLVVHACEYNQHDNHGRTIAVASVDKKKHHVGSTLTLMNLHLPLSM